jgi:hypothetical protein
VWDADYFLSREETLVANGPLCLMYEMYKKPESFRGTFPHGLALPPLASGQTSLMRPFPEQPSLADIRSAVATAKATLGLTQRP